MGSVILALLVLLLPTPSLLWLVVFAGLFGFGNGLLTIVRGTVVAEASGRERHAETNGALSAPAVQAKAVAPLALAALWSATQTQVAVTFTVLVLVGLSSLGLLQVVRLRSQHANFGVHESRQASTHRAGDGSDDPIASGSASEVRMDWGHVIGSAVLRRFRSNNRKRNGMRLRPSVPGPADDRPGVLQAPFKLLR